MLSEWIPSHSFARLLWWTIRKPRGSVGLSPLSTFLWFIQWSHTSNQFNSNHSIKFFFNVNSKYLTLQLFVFNSLHYLIEKIFCFEKSSGYFINTIL
jgi:hypothetical protein